MAGRILQATEPEQAPHDPCPRCDGPVDRHEGEVRAKYMERRYCCNTCARRAAADNSRGRRLAVFEKQNWTEQTLNGPVIPDFSAHNVTFTHPPKYVYLPIRKRHEVSGMGCSAELCVSETGVRE